MAMWARFVLVAVCCSAFAASPRAVAQDDTRPAHDAEAHALFEAGRAAFTDGRYEVALDRFRQAYALSRRPELLYNIGHAADRLRRDGDALEAFERYLQALPDAENADEVRGRVAAIRVARSHAEESGPPPASAGAAPASEDHVHSRQADGAESGDDVLESWWLWTIVGVAVVGVGVGIGVGVATTSSGPAPGDVGGVVLTLEAW